MGVRLARVTSDREPGLGTASGEVQTMTAKQLILRTLEDLPEEATVEDAIETLFLLYKVERGIAQADNGERVSQDEARRRMARWLR